MKKIFIILIMFSALIANAQWVQQNSGITSNLYDVKFINRYTGWALGDGGKVLKTTNGGINWMNIPNPSYIGGGILSSIFPVDSMYCYVAGGYDVILKTTNGGSNWIEISNGPLLTGGYNGVSFINRDTGWFCGSHRLLRTTNGGITFDSSSTPTFTNDLYFKNFNEGLYCNTGEVYKTTNSGMNWFNTNVPTNGLGYEFNKLSVVNNQYVSIIGNGPPFYRSTDFGNTWAVIDSIKSYPPSMMRCCAFANINTGYAGGTYGYLYKTTNGGHNWYRQNSGTMPNAFWGSLHCFNDSVVWGVGGAGKIMFTSNGGQWLTEIQNNNKEILTSYSLSQNYPNPFNNSTRIKYQISVASNVKIKIFNISGKEEITLFNKEQSSGNHELLYKAEDLSSGIYFYTLYLNDIIKETKKMILIK
ncbi:MAG: YCF48-related protein [Ignavibacteriota bacterium]